MESPFFDRSRYRTDYHTNVVLYSTLSATDVNIVLKQIARQSADEKLLSQSRDYYAPSASGSPTKAMSEGVQLPNPIHVVVPLMEPSKKSESDRARVNMKLHVKTRQTTRQELVVDAVAEIDRRMVVDFVMLLFDLTDRASFEALDKLLDNFKRDYGQENLAEPTTILAVGKVQNQEIHQLIYRDEIDLWCGRQHSPSSTQMIVKYLEYTVMYSQGVHDLIAVIVEPFQTKYVTQLSREKSLESPGGHRGTTIGNGFFQASFAPSSQTNDSPIMANNSNTNNNNSSNNHSILMLPSGGNGHNGDGMGAHSNVMSNAMGDTMNYSHDTESTEQIEGNNMNNKRKKPAILDQEYRLSQSDLLERREEQKRYERQRKWQDMEWQMRLMLESDQLEENQLAEREEQNRLQQLLQQQQQQQQEQTYNNTAANPTSNTTNNNLHVSTTTTNNTSNSIMSTAIGFFRSLPSLPPSPSHAQHSISQSNHNSASNGSLPPPSPSISPPLATQSSSPSTSLVLKKRFSKSLHPPNPPHQHMHNTYINDGSHSSSLKSRSEDAYDNHHHHNHLYSQHNQYHHTNGKSQSNSNTNMYNNNSHVVTTANIISNYPRSRPISSSTLKLPPLPANLHLHQQTNNPASNNTNNDNATNLTNNNSNNATNNSTNHSHNNSGTSKSGNTNNTTNIPISSSSSSSISLIQNALKRTSSLRSQISVSQQTSSQVSLKSRHSSHYTMNSSRASSGLDLLLVPSPDEINLLIENMHSAVKAEQDLYHQTMYLYGNHGSDLLLLSSEDDDDEDNDDGAQDDEDPEDQYHEEEDHPDDHSHTNTSNNNSNSEMIRLNSSGLDSLQPPSSTTTGGSNNQRQKKASQKQRQKQQRLEQQRLKQHALHLQQQQHQKLLLLQQHSSRMMNTNSNNTSNNNVHITNGKGNGRGHYGSYISDLSTTSSRYTQNSLEERGLIDPDRLMSVHSPSHYSHASNSHNTTTYHSSSNNKPGVFPMFPAAQEEQVVASLVGGHNHDKEEEDRLLDIIVGLAPSPASPRHKKRPSNGSNGTRRNSGGDKSNSNGNGNGNKLAMQVLSESNSDDHMLNRRHHDSNHHHSQASDDNSSLRGTEIEEIPSLNSPEHPQHNNGSSRRRNTRFTIGCGCT